MLSSPSSQLLLPHTTDAGVGEGSDPGEEEEPGSEEGSDCEEESEDEGPFTCIFKATLLLEVSPSGGVASTLAVLVSVPAVVARTVIPMAARLTGVIIPMGQVTVRDSVP